MSVVRSMRSIAEENEIDGHHLARGINMVKRNLTGARTHAQNNRGTALLISWGFYLYHHNGVRILCWPLAKLPPAPSGFPPGQSALFCQNVRFFIWHRSQKSPKMSGFLIWGPLLLSRVLTATAQNISGSWSGGSLGRFYPSSSGGSRINLGFDVFPRRSNFQGFSDQLGCMYSRNDPTSHTNTQV